MPVFVFFIKDLSCDFNLYELFDVFILDIFVLLVYIS